MSRSANAVLERVDRVLAACGGGLVLVVGDAVQATVEAWRHRGVPARAGAVAEVAADAPMELIWLEGVLESLTEPEVAALLDQARRQSPRALIVGVGGPRDDWEGRILRRGWRKHPLYQQVVDYTALDRGSRLTPGTWQRLVRCRPPRST